MVNIVNEQIETPESEVPGKAPWSAPRVARIHVGDAAAGDSFSGEGGGSFS